jgi:hypothetical protein
LPALSKLAAKRDNDRSHCVDINGRSRLAGNNDARTLLLHTFTLLVLSELQTGGPWSNEPPGFA